MGKLELVVWKYDCSTHGKLTKQPTRTVTKALKAETEETVLNGEGKKLLLLLFLFIIFSLSGICLHISTLIVDSRIFTHHIFLF
jgi:hypothetical protein